MPVFQGAVDGGGRVPPSKGLLAARSFAPSMAPAGPAASTGHSERSDGRSSFGGRRRRLRVWLPAALGGSLQFDKVCVVQQAIADSIGEIGVADGGVPVLDGDLAGDQRRGPLAAVLDDLDEVAPFVVAQRCQQPVVDREEIELRQSLEDARVRPIATGHGDLLKQARQSS